MAQVSTAIAPDIYSSQYADDPVLGLGKEEPWAPDMNPLDLLLVEKGSKENTISYEISERDIKLFTELEEILIGCSRDDWDGEDSIGVSRVSVQFAKKFLRLMPDTIPTPEITPDPDGYISFEWYVDRKNSLMLSIGPAPVIYFAGVFGQDEKLNGKTKLGDEIPDPITGSLAKLYRS